MRKPVIIANWKMNKSINESISYAKRFKKLVKKNKNIDIIICPSFLSIEPLYTKLKKTQIKIGAQNIFHEKKGAFTGEISPLMLKHCSYVILGHSERRAYFNETNPLINKKIKFALESNLKPVLCIGETLKEKKQKKTKSVLRKQLTECLKSINKNQIKKIVIAYEPIWAISKGNPSHKSDNPADAEEIHLFIRNELKKKYKKLSDKIRIIYGGSVNKNNMDDFMVFDNIDGALVGGASLNPTSFSNIVNLI